MKIFKLFFFTQSVYNNRILAYVIFSFISFFNAHAEFSSLKYRKVTSNNLLSHTAVECIVRDSTGFIWVGTRDGLNRYDGYQYQTYKYNPDDPNSISNNEISCLAIQNNYLWIGTRGGGINRLNLLTGKNSRYNYDSFDGMIKHMAIDKNGYVWIATSIGLLKYIDDNKNGYFKNMTAKAVFRKETNEPFIPKAGNIAVKVIYPTKSGDLLIGADAGIFNYHINSGIFKILDSELENIETITAINEDMNGAYWIGCYDGLIKVTPQVKEENFIIESYNSSLKKPYYLKNNRVEDIEVDSKGKIWVALHGEGLLSINNQKFSYFNDAINDKYVINIINDLFFDKTGILWIGSENESLVNINLLSSGIKTIEPKIKNNSDKYQLSTISLKNNQLLTGTFGRGIEQFTFKDGRLTYSKNISITSYKGTGWSNEIKELLFDDDIWIGFDDTRLIKYSFNGDVNYYDTWGFIFALMEDSHNNIWYGTWGNGIGYVNKETGIIERYVNSQNKTLGISSNVILSLIESSTGDLLVGTKGGGINIAPIKNIIDCNKNFTVFLHDPTNKNSISHNDVYDIFESKSGEIWIGTGRGINKLIPKEGYSLSESILNKAVRFIQYTEKDGLPGGIVYSICEDGNGDLWLGTNRGVCKVSFNDEKITVYNNNDEFPSNSFENNNLIYDPQSGFLFFSSHDKITYFHPDSLFIDRRENMVHFTGLEIQNHKIEPGETYNGRIIMEKDIFDINKLEFKYFEKLISFEFSALQHSASNRVRYAYRLVGFNDDWIETENVSRKITYTNLNPGNYSLQVKASKNDGNWSNSIAELQIKVLPPFWLTIWAYILYFIITISLLLVFRRYSVIAVEQKNKLKIKEIEHRKETEIAEAKIRFFTNVSHEIRTPLTLIYEPLKQLFASGELTNGANDLAQIVMRNMKRLLNQVNQLLELRKIDECGYTLKHTQFPLKELFTKVIYEFEALIKKKNTIIANNISDSLMIVADRQMLDTVIYNLISNALKFISSQNGKLIFEAVTNADDNDVKKDFVKILISDNGPGISEDEIENVFDYFYQTKNVEKANIGGTGIGLAIVKEYIKLHDGTISVKNNRDEGCCFEIMLPLNKKPVIQEDTNPIIEKSSGNIDILLSNLKNETNDSESSMGMVIIEDDVDLGTYLTTIFSSQFNVTHFTDGKKASGKIAELSPDIIICDLMLPGMNGLELTAFLKENIETSHIPIIMLTAKAEDESRVKGLQHGADSYLTKPFNTDILIAQVDSIIKSRKAFKEKFGTQMVLEPSQDIIVPRDEKFLHKIMAITEDRLSDSSFEVTDIVKEMGMSHTLLLKKFKALTGLSLVEFVRSMRLKKAKQLFKQDKFFVADVAYMVGFSDPKYFSKCFTKEVGQSPTDYIKQFHSE
ncbi:MAG: response regulator [Marinilabiliaceae bacterium]|nr:response regulator [Marinilabiliaceae bacterium]